VPEGSLTGCSVEEYYVTWAESELGVQMVRMIVEFTLAAVFVVLAIVTAVNPQWIEAVSDIGPDGGSGALEWIIVAALGVLAVIAAGLGTRSAIVRGRSAPV
jgi:hypothetical protein